MERSVIEWPVAGRPRLESQRTAMLASAPLRHEELSSSGVMLVIAPRFWPDQSNLTDLYWSDPMERALACRQVHRAVRPKRHSSLSRTARTFQKLRAT